MLLDYTILTKCKGQFDFRTMWAFVKIVLYGKIVGSKFVWYNFKVYLQDVFRAFLLKESWKIICNRVIM